MARSTQYIGLTDDAKEFIKLNGFVPSIIHSAYITHDMFGDDIKLQVWQGKFRNKQVVLFEKLQVCPWSSGPMLFTHLEMDFLNGARVEIFSWVLNPCITNEFDNRKGHYWV